MINSYCNTCGVSVTLIYFTDLYVLVPARADTLKTYGVKYIPTPEDVNESLVS